MFDETGMGVYADKVAKHQKKTLGTLRDLQGLKTTGIIEENKEKGLIKIAKPVGVIGALTPVTNASSTVSCNGLVLQRKVRSKSSQSRQSCLAMRAISDKIAFLVIPHSL